MKKLIIILFAVFSLTACKVDEEQNNLREEIIELEAEGKLPSNLDRTDTLLGIDANNNGVRDDVEAWIEKNYPNHIKEAMQFARSMQHVMGLDTTNELDVRKVDMLQARAVACLVFKRDKTKAPNVALEMMREIASITKNTKERVLAGIRFGRVLNGRVLARAKKEESCDEN